MNAPDTSSSQFRAPWGTMLTLVSIFTSVLLLGLAFLPLPAAMPEWARFMTHWLGVFLMLTCAPFTVRGYRVGNGALWVRRLFWETRIGLAEMTEVHVEPNPFRWSLRTCGNGGLYSISGWFWSRRLGTFRVYATRLGEGVLVVFRNRKPVLLTPDDARGLADAVSREVDRLTTAQGRAD